MSAGSLSASRFRFLAACQAALHLECAHSSATLRAKVSYPCFKPESSNPSTTKAPGTLSDTGPHRTSWTSWKELLPSLLSGGVDRAGWMGTQDGAVLPRKVEPPLNSTESSTHHGPGSWRGLCSLRGGQLGAALRAAFPRVHHTSGGFLSPLVVVCVWPVSNSQGSAGRKPAPASQHAAKNGFHHTQTWGLGGPFVNRPCRSLVPQGGPMERGHACYGGHGALPMVTRSTEKGWSHPFYLGVQVSEAAWTQICSKVSKQNLSTFMGDGKLRVASLMPRLRPE